MTQNQLNPGKSILIAILLFCLLTYLSRFMTGFPFDIECWQRWILYIHHHGLSNTYHSDTNYMPFYQYVMWAYSKLMRSDEAIVANIRYLRCVTYIFDFAALWYAYKWMEGKVSLNVLLLVNLLNLGYMYNSLVWGQLDGISATMSFIAFYYAYKGNNIWSTIWIMLSVNMKMQVIIFLPMWAFLCLNNLAGTRNWKQVIPMFLIAATMQFLFLLPFIISGTVPLIWNIIAGAVGFFPNLTAGAASFWFFIPNINPWHLPDSTLFMAGLSYRQAGLLLFGLSSLAAMWPLIKNTALKMMGREKEVQVSKERIWLMSAIVALSFFYFNTQMHERYSHPAFIFIIAYAFYSRDFLPYIIFSIAYFMNLERVLGWLPINHENSIFDYFRLMSGMYAFVFVYLFVRLYKSQPTKGLTVPGVKKAP